MQPFSKLIQRDQQIEFLSAAFLVFLPRAHIQPLRIMGQPAQLCGENCFTLPDSTFSAINPAMFTGSLADEKGGA